MRDVPVVAGGAGRGAARLPALLREGRGGARAVHGPERPIAHARDGLPALGEVGKAVVGKPMGTGPDGILATKDRRRQEGATGGLSPMELGKYINSERLGSRAGPCGRFAARASPSANPTPSARAHSRSAASHN